MLRRVWPGVRAWIHELPTHHIPKPPTQTAVRAERCIVSQNMTATRPVVEQRRERKRVESGWLAIAGLLLLSALPVIGGVLRLTGVSANPDTVVPVTSVVVIGAHIVAMIVYCLVGAFQFSPALRVRSRWHRRAGRVLLPAGFIAAISSVWIGVFFGGPADELALARVRLVFALAMTIFLVMTAVAITRRDFSAHGAWMTRAYATAVSGGTQALAVALWTIVISDIDALGEAWLVAAGFVINSVVAELLVRRRRPNH
jgi:hypothetical protein